MPVMWTDDLTVVPEWWNDVHDDVVTRVPLEWTNWRDIRHADESITAFDDAVEVGAIERRNLPVFRHGFKVGFEIEFRRIAG